MPPPLIQLHVRPAVLGRHQPGRSAQGGATAAERASAAGEAGSGFGAPPVSLQLAAALRSRPSPAPQAPGDNKLQRLQVPACRSSPPPPLPANACPGRPASSMLHHTGLSLANPPLPWPSNRADFPPAAPCLFLTASVSSILAEQRAPCAAGAAAHPVQRPQESQRQPPGNKLPKAANHARPDTHHCDGRLFGPPGALPQRSTTGRAAARERRRRRAQRAAEAPQRSRLAGAPAGGHAAPGLWERRRLAAAGE